MRWMVVGTVLASSVAHVEAAPPVIDEKSPQVAAALSLTPTLGGVGLVAFGLYTANRDRTCDIGGVCKDHFDRGLALTITGGVLLAVGPSLGHLYNERVWTTGVKVRLVGLGIGAAGLLVMGLGSHNCAGFVCTKDAIGALVAICGGVTFGVGALIDAVRAQRAVHERNAQLMLGRVQTARGSTPALRFSTPF